MDYMWVIITVAVLVVLAIASRTRLWNKMGSSVETVFSETNLSPLLAVANDMAQLHEVGITIPIELLPATTLFEEKSLFPITDSTIVARISQAIPGAAQTAANTAAKSAVKEVLRNPDMYLARIPAGTKLVNPTRKGVQYAFYDGVKGGSAQLEKVDLSKMTKATGVAHGVANVMNVGSLVVGQYYMSEISARLDTMTKSIDRVGDFQDREFKGRILSVITLVGEISHFSCEIIEDDEQRNLKLAALDNLKATATELLGQVNITISDIAQKTLNPDYEEYESKVHGFQKLVAYQNAMVTVLEEISTLTYLLGKGSISTERSYSTFNKYLELSVQTRVLLGEWHDKQVKALRIDLEKERITKTGFQALVSAVPGLFDDKFRYKELSQSLASEISIQATNILRSPTKPKQVYDGDVDIIIKDGKYYYLHQSFVTVQETG